MKRSLVYVGWLFLGLTGLSQASPAQALPSAFAGAAQAKGSAHALSSGTGAASRLLDTQERFELIDIDTLFYIDNRGLTRILADLNGHKFKLVTDPVEVQQSANAFLIPAFGEITLNIAAFIQPGDGNYIEIISQGPEGSDALILIGDLLVPSQEVAYAIADLVELPARLDLLASYPNSFRDRTTITYRIPEERTNGLQVHLAIYDVLGRRMQVLVEDLRFPGTFSVQWDGRDAGGRAVASGVYLYRLTAGEHQQVKRLILLR